MTTKPTNPKDSLSIRRAPLSTVPANVIAELGVAMLEGAVKYGRHNYRDAGVRASVYYDATMRHLMAWWEGEDIDKDSGLSHITKAIASLVVLRDAMMQGKVEDDRPPASAEFYNDLNDAAGEIVDLQNQFELNGKKYKAIRGQTCNGCAFHDDDDGCDQAQTNALENGVKHCHYDYIYQEVKK